MKESLLNLVCCSQLILVLRTCTKVVQVYPTDRDVKHLAESGRRLAPDFAEGARDAAFEEALDASGEFSTVLSAEEDREAFGVEDSDPPTEALPEDAFEFNDLAEDGFESLDLAEDALDASDLADDALELTLESLSLSSFSGTLLDALDFAEELLEEALEEASFFAEPVVFPEGEGVLDSEGDLEAPLESFLLDSDFPLAVDWADFAEEALEDFRESISAFALSGWESSFSDLAEETRELALDLLSALSSSALKELLDTVLVEAPPKDFADAALEDFPESALDDFEDSSPADFAEPALEDFEDSSFVESRLESEEAACSWIVVEDPGRLASFSVPITGVVLSCSSTFDPVAMLSESLSPFSSLSSSSGFPPEDFTCSLSSDM